jgi:hypothetical protein
MAESDGLRQAYNIPAVAAARPGYVFSKNRRQKKQDKKKQETPGEQAAEEETGDGKQHVDIKV